MSVNAYDNRSIRAQFKALRERMSAKDCEKASDTICGTLYSIFHANPAYADCVYLVYFPFRKEVDIRAFIEELSCRGERFFYPVINGDNMDFYEADPVDRFEVNNFGISEPKDRSRRYEGERAVVITPGVAFSEKGDRIGFGRGYYDRFFAMQNASLYKVGVCYESQICNRIVPAKTDVPMDVIVTEDRLIRMRT